MATRRRQRLNSSRLLYSKTNEIKNSQLKAVSEMRQRLLNTPRRWGSPPILEKTYE